MSYWIAFRPFLALEAVLDFALPSCMQTRDTTIPGAGVLARNVASNPGLHARESSPKTALADIVGWLNEPMRGEPSSVGFGFEMNAEPIFTWLFSLLVALSSVGISYRGFVRVSKLKNDMRVSHSGKVLPKGLMLEASIEVGSGIKEYCAGYDTALYCLQDRDKNGSFDKVQIVGGGRPLESVSGGYNLEHQPVDDLSAWRKEILYQGASAGVARFTFREYGSDWTTPKVSQDLAYDLSPDGSTEIVYQGARIQILRANSNGVRYKVLSGFRSAGQGGGN